MDIDTTKPYVCVIGGLNIDLQGSSDAPLVFNDSNPGEIEMSAGGVGRNIAENMARISIDAKILSYVGNDALGDFVINKTKMANVDTSLLIEHSTLPTSQYLSLLDDNNDMLASISDMRIIDEMTIQDIINWKDVLDLCGVIVIDTNIPVKVIEHIVEHYSHIPLFLDPVSFAKTSKVLHIIGKFHTIKPNKLEAELISGISIIDDETMLNAAQNIFDKGCKQIFITLGNEGVFYFDGKDYGHYLHQGVNIKSANGAGDAFTAGVVYGFLNHSSIEETAKFASAAAVIALQSKNTISENLSEHNIKLLLKD